MRLLPGDLSAGCAGPVGRGEPRGVCCVCGRSESVRTHVCDPGRLCGGSRRRYGLGRVDSACCPSRLEAAAYLLRRPELAPTVGTGARDRVPGTRVGRRLSLEQRKDALSAIGSPQRHQAPTGIAERLRGGHPLTLPYRPADRFRSPPFAAEVTR